MADKRISQLNSHINPSGSDLLVIVSNNETKKITYEDLKDSIVINSDNALLNAFSASYLNDSASFNTRITAATNEQSLTHLVTTSSFNILSASVDNRVDSLESWSSSLDSTFATDLQVSIVSSSVAATIGIISQNTGLLSTSSFNEYTASQSTASLVSRLDVLESHTGSYLTSLNGTISGSSQLTSSYDERYILSGSIVEMPLGIISGSSQLTSSFDTRYSLSGSNLNLNTSSLATTGSNQFSGSQYISGSVIFNNGTQIYQNDDDIHISSSGEIRVTSNNSNYKFGNDGNFYTSVGGVVFSHDGLINQIPGASGDNINIVVGINDGIVLTTDAGDGDYAWDFDKNGDLTVPGNVYGAPNLATKGSNVFDGNQIITGSLVVSGSTDLTQLRITGDLNVLGNITGSIRATNGVISGSSQLTSSYDTRYTLSGSVQPLPSNLVSSSAQITAFGFVSSSTTIPAGTISGSSQLTSSYDSRYSLSGSILTSFSSSVDNRLDTLEASIISGSINYTQVLGNRRTGITSVGTSIISGSITTTGNPVQIMVTGDANPITTAWCRLQIFRDGNGIGNIIQVENSSNLNVPYCLNVIDTPSAGTYTYSMRTVDSMSGTFDFGEHNGPLLTAVELKSNTQLPSGLISGSSQLPSGIISGSSQLTSSYDTRYTLSGSVQPLPSGLISGSSQVLGGSGIYSSSAQLPSGLISGSSQLPSGIVSGSSQLTASYDTRYTLSGSVVSGTTPAGTISGSSQLTSSFDSRYVQTGSFNTLTASFNSFTASAQSVTTGSNSFNGNQTITGSLTVTNANVIASSITANTSSLYLTSGSNLYVQNNGIVEITGSLKVSGSTNLIVSNLQIGTGSGDEGGEIQLAKAVTNTTLTGSAVTVDVYRDRVRIFEQGGDARGVYIDLSKAPGGVAGELTWKASGIVNAGTFVTLDNIKATLTSSSNRGLSVAAVSTNFSANISAYHAYSGGIAGISANNQSITTTPTTSLFGWNFPAEADGSYYNILDKTNNRFYRITLMIGATFNNNFISIERLY